MGRRECSPSQKLLAPLLSPLMPCSGPPSTASPPRQAPESSTLCPHWLTSPQHFMLQPQGCHSATWGTCLLFPGAAKNPTPPFCQVSTDSALSSANVTSWRKPSLTTPHSDLSQRTPTAPSHIPHNVLSCATAPRHLLSIPNPCAFHLYISVKPKSSPRSPPPPAKCRPLSSSSWTPGPAASPAP